MHRLLVSLVASIAVASMLVVGCAQSGPAPSPTKPAAAVPTAAPPTKSAVAVPTAAPLTKALDFPAKNRTITLISPWDAGGASDLAMRMLAPSMEKELGVPVQVVDRPGAGSQVGLTEIVGAKPDGYTIGETNIPTTILVYLDKNRKANFGRQSFEPLSMVDIDFSGIAVKADSPIKSPKDLIDAAKAKPGSIKIADPGFLSGSHLDTLLLAQSAGVRFSSVHFSGGAPAITALLGGHVDAVSLATANIMPQVKSGQVRVIGLMSQQESAFYPGVKTFQSQGYNVLGVGGNHGLSVPAGTPKEIVNILAAAVKKAVETDDAKKKLDEMGLTRSYLDPVQFGAAWDQLETVVKPLLAEAEKQQ